jgi:hypothetical protein
MNYGAEIFCGSGKYIKECEKKKIWDRTIGTGITGEKVKKMQLYNNDTIHSYVKGKVFINVCIVPFFQRWNRSGFLTTGTGTGLSRSDRTRSAGLPVTGRSEIFSRTAFVSW